MGRGATARRVVLTGVLTLAPAGVSAQQGLAEGFRAVLDTNVSVITTTVTTDASTVTTTTRTLFPRLTVDTHALILPALRLNAGGTFEVNRSFIDNDLLFAGTGGGTTSSITQLRPFFELRSTNRVLSPGFGYYRREIRTSVGRLPSLRLVSEDVAGYLGWKPEGLPESDVQFVRTTTFDGGRVFQDTTKDFGSIISRYAYKNLNLYYRGAYLDTTERVNQLDTRQWSNAARTDYAGDFLKDRLRWNVTYNVSRQDLTTVARGEGGEVPLPVNAFAGLSALSDTPVTTTLSPNPPLIDGNLTASAGLNLGVTGAGADAQARNMGLDFLSPTEVNRVLVWVDRELPASIAATFSWEVYTSVDNLVWTRETLVSTAPFGPFENRFQVDFPSVTARYLKLVTRPLSGAVLDASRYPEIFVTELQAFLTRSPGEVPTELTRTNQIFSTDVRLRLLEKPLLYYEGNYWYNGFDAPVPDRDTLSNGLSVNHRFNRVMAAYARGAYEQGRELEGRRTATVTNATLTLDPIPTLTSSVLFSGVDETIGDRLNDRKGFLVQTAAQVYRGVDVQFGFGWNFTTREGDEHLRDRLLNLNASIVPRQNLTLTLNYIDTTTTRSGTFTGDPRYHARRGFLTLAFDPIRTLHLVVSEEIVAITGEKTRTTHNVGANWTPFPDGALQLTVAYNENVRPLAYGTDRVFRPGVRWTFSRQSYVDVSYQLLETEFVGLKTESKIFGVDLKVFF